MNVHQPEIRMLWTDSHVGALGCFTRAWHCKFGVNICNDLRLSKGPVGFRTGAPTNYRDLTRKTRDVQIKPWLSLQICLCPWYLMVLITVDSGSDQMDSCGLMWIDMDYGMDYGWISEYLSNVLLVTQLNWCSTESESRMKKCCGIRIEESKIFAGFNHQNPKDCWWNSKKRIIKKPQNYWSGDPYSG